MSTIRKIREAGKVLADPKSTEKEIVLALSSLSSVVISKESSSAEITLKESFEKTKNRDLIILVKDDKIGEFSVLSIDELEQKEQVKLYSAAHKEYIRTGVNPLRKKSK